jgi:hypothetical protein
MMKRVIAIGLLGLGLAACHRAVPPEVLQQWQSRPLFTCCNIHYEGNEITDANYYAGSMLPFGSPAAVQRMTADSVTFRSGGTELTLYHSYGRDQESAQQFFSKILVPDDPHTRFAAFPKDVQDAIRDGRVERGMTREQVIMSLGYPPTHRTASTDLNTWTYWYNRWATYTVQFGDDGKVTMIVGNAPTHNQPIANPTPIPPPPVRSIHRKSKQ